MNVIVSPHALAGAIVTPPSKSYAHRWLLAAYLSGREVTLRRLGDSHDVTATLEALESLSLSAVQFDDGLTVRAGIMPAEATLRCYDSGSTFRFLLPVAAALGVRATFALSDSLRARPIRELVDSLNAHGAAINGLTVGGKLTAGDYHIDAGVSSQYVTGLLFALPLLACDSRILFEGEVVSRSYIDITLDVLARCGVVVRPIEGGYYVAGRQAFCPPDAITVEGDWSGAAFALAGGAIGGDVRMYALRCDSRQGDSRILPLLRAFGADVEMDESSVRVRRGTLRGIEIDLTDIPDLAQILSVVAAYAEGNTVLRHVSRLRLKECDRLSAICVMLERAGIACRLEGDDLIITGGAPHGARFPGNGDHRSVMSAAILAAYAASDSEIAERDAVNKSYPAFWQDFTALGGQVHGDL